ncbi:MAG: hypothetical protein QOJ54_1030, partial [Aliidongia sp.]|nr:hypothetical protein [Aliidongia sp.]
ADAILSEGMVIMTMPSPGGAQNTTCLRLDLMNGWLFGIEDNRVKHEATRQKVLTYKRECYRVLYEHFHAKAAAVVGGMADLDEDDRPRPLDEPAPAVEDLFHGRPLREVTLALSLVRENRLLFGHAQARALYRRTLPEFSDVTAPTEPGDEGSGQGCLQALFTMPVDLAQPRIRMTIGQLVRAALDPQDTRHAIAVAALPPFGLKVDLHSERRAMIVANRHHGLSRLFFDTDYSDGRWRRALKALAIEPVGRIYSFGGVKSRGLAIPAALLPIDPVQQA